VDDLAVGQMKLARVGEHRIALIRTPSGIHALDNACPHQGYGHVTGSLDGELVTCQWHNWKFRAEDGQCLIGEEDVACHQVDIRDGEIVVTVTEPSAEEAQAALWPSLSRGFERDYVGQMARDVGRLLQTGATPEEIIWRGIQLSGPKVEYGIGHGMAMAADCLTISDLYDGLDKTLPITQALSGMSEGTRGRDSYPLPDGDASIDLAAAIEAEDLDAALAATVGLIEAGASADDLLSIYVQAVSSHHLNYGHGAIYTQKSFELLDRVGWDKAVDLLPWLTMSLTYGTREDTLPYMRKAMRAIEAVDLASLADAPTADWVDHGQHLRSAMLNSDEAPIDAAVAAALDGAGVPGILDTVTLAVSERLLRYDPSTDFDLDVDFGWLDITHGLTYARAARYLWDRQPCEAAARLALFTVFLCHDTGRAERWSGVDHPTPDFTSAPGDVAGAVLDGKPDDAVAHALHADPHTAGQALVRASQMDRSGAFIVAAHVIKLAQAAYEESLTIGSNLPLAAAARFAAAPRLERFVARNAAEAIGFLQTGAPPKR